MRLFQEWELQVYEHLKSISKKHLQGVCRVPLGVRGGILPSFYGQNEPRCTHLQSKISAMILFFSVLFFWRTHMQVDFSVGGRGQHVIL